MLWIPAAAAGIIGLGRYWGYYRNFGAPDASTNISPWGLCHRRRAAQQPPHLPHLGQVLGQAVLVRHPAGGWIRAIAALGLAQVRSTPQAGDLGQSSGGRLPDAGSHHRQPLRGDGLICQEMRATWPPGSTPRRPGAPGTTGCLSSTSPRPGCRRRRSRRPEELHPTTWASASLAKLVAMREKSCMDWNQRLGGSGWCSTWAWCRRPSSGVVALGDSLRHAPCRAARPSQAAQAAADSIRTLGAAAAWPITSQHRHGAAGCQARWRHPEETVMPMLAMSSRDPALRPQPVTRWLAAPAGSGCNPQARSEAAQHDASSFAPDTGHGVVGTNQCLQAQADRLQSMHGAAGRTGR